MSFDNSVSLKLRVFKASMWSVAGYGLTTSIRFGTNLLMTRLLVPKMFGVMAIATTVMVGLAMFSDVGLRQSIVQSSRGKEPRFLNTAWVTQIARGLILWVFAGCVSLAILLGARGGLIAPQSIYAAPDLPSVILASSVTALLAGFESTKLFEASRNLSLARVANIDIVAQLVGLACMLTWVSIDRSIWVLVAGGLSSGLTRAVLSHAWLSGTTNHFEWESTAFWEIIHFGRWIFLSSVLGFLVINGDRLQVAALVDASVFGVYVIAILTFGAIEQIITKIISDVSFPALSEIVRERPRELKSKYYQFRILFSGFANIASGFLLVSGNVLIAAMYDGRYSQAGWMLQALAVCLVFTPFQVAAQCLMALGRPQALSNLAVIRFVTLFTFLPAGFYLNGLHGAIWGIVLSRSSILPLTFYYKAKHKLLDVKIEVSLLSTIIVGVILGTILNQLVTK